MALEEDGFFSRWSRRKAQGKATAALAGASPGPQAGSTVVSVPPVPAPVATVAPNATAGAELPPPAVTLDDVQALTPASDFRPFVARQVTSVVRNAAMKKLFADPHFNVMDGLDIYIDDYSRPDPVAPEVLRQLLRAHDRPAEVAAADPAPPTVPTEPAPDRPLPVAEMAPPPAFPPQALPTAEPADPTEEPPTP